MGLESHRPLSDPKVKRVGEATPLVAPTLRVRRKDDTGKYVPWRTTSPRGDEAVRWECVDGRWITISLGRDQHAGQALVANAAGQQEYVDSFEDALELAKKWRTV